MEYSARLILYKHKTLSDGSHPIVLQIIYNRRIKRKSIGISTFPEHFDDSDPDSPVLLNSASDYKTKRITLNDALHRIDTADKYFQVNTQIPFTVSKYLSKFNGDKKKVQIVTIEVLFNELIDKYTEEGRISYAQSFKNVRNSILKYIKGKNYILQDIDYQFLTDYETFLRSSGNKVATLMNYIGSIRTALIYAINNEYLEPSLYPFKRFANQVGKFNFGKFKKQHKSRALSQYDMDKIKAFDTAINPHLKWAHDIFMWSYYARGMNFKDIALLEHADIYDNQMDYTRSKTKSNQKKNITPPLQRILDHCEKAVCGKYVFNILDSRSHITPTQQFNRIKKMRRRYNGNLKEIADKLGIPLKLSSYVSRHTYSMTLKRNGVTLETISKNLGHRDLKTTEFYLDAMSCDEGEKADKFL